MVVIVGVRREFLHHYFHNGEEIKSMFTFGQSNFSVDYTQ
jgi:hypothetical protein